MKINKKQILALICLAPTLGWCDQEGTFTAAFLSLGQGARAEGMGGAFTAVADDSHAPYWNPAGLALSKRQKLSFDYLKHIEEINTQNVSYVRPIKATGGGLGLSATYADLGSIERRDATGAKVSGDEDVNGLSAEVSYGQSFNEVVYVGAGLKSIQQNLAGTKSSGFAGDLGLLATLIPQKLTLGASILNLGPTISVGTEKEKIPLTYRGGLALHVIPRQLVFDAELQKAEATDASIHIGGEYIYQGQFVIRAGYQDNQESGGGISAGAGFIWHPSQSRGNDMFKNHKSMPVDEAEEDEGLELRIDYAFVDYGTFESTHRIGIELAF